MPSRNGLATALRALRASKGLRQIDLVSATARRYVHNIEHAKSGISLEKLEEVAAAVGVDPIAFLVIASAVSRSTTPDAVIELAIEDLKAFQAAGGMDRLAEQIDLGPNQVRAMNRQAKIEAVRACRDRGLTRKETAEELAMPKSTVASFWNA